ncbi:hypothetical protein MSBR3_1935 [Methanosarcina barkeri 3]|uniref:YopA central domain-containing protein n=2 Tax=Methanosarcina barkeri TaxID=2208 RepID=A0A0E3SN33_METBA|nr:hypothetical protein MSBR3_1935 [Methanosarcina barkeri 3]
MLNFILLWLVINMEEIKCREQFVPLFPFNEQNKSVVIAKDQVLIKDSNKIDLFTLNAEIHLDFLPKPRIHIHITNIDELDYVHRVELFALICTPELYSLELKSHKKNIEAWITTSNPKEYSLIFSPPSEPIVGLGDEDTQMHYVVFHLFNFKKICANKGKYCEDVHLEADNWIIELKPSGKSEMNFEKLKKEGGYCLTHIGHLRKKDNTLISGKEAAHMLSMLYYFFSFAKGNWCNPVCAVGVNSSDRVWESWSSPKESCSSAKGSWFDEHHSEQLENIFPGFMNLWVSEDWKETFQKVIYWYIISNTSNIDAGVILTQSALERLYSEHFKANSSRNINAAKKLEDLFCDLNIPIDLTDNTPKLKKLAEDVNDQIDTKKLDKNTKWINAPIALTKMRNYLVHPRNIYEPLKFGSAIHDSWNLGLWYLELSLLRECGYLEDYRNRLIPRWVGEVEKVPWKK